MAGELTGLARKTTPRRDAGPAAAGTLWLLAPVAGVFVVLVLLPLGFLVSTALEDGPGHALSAVTGNLFLESIVRTLVMATTVTAISLLLGVTFAFAVAVSGTVTRALLLGVLLASFSVSLLVRTYGWVILLQPSGFVDEIAQKLGLVSGSLNLTGTTLSMYPAMIQLMLPFMVLPLIVAFRAIPATQLRAARSLGASSWMTITRVVLPQVRSGAVAGSVIVFVLSLGFYIVPAFLGGPGDFTIATIVDHKFRNEFDFSAAAALGTTVLVAILVIYGLADRLLGVGRYLEVR